VNNLPAIEHIDLKGLSVSPGFIDVQVNGGGGVLFNDHPDIEGIKTIVNGHRRYGTTDLLPTFITGSIQGMQKAAQAVQDYMRAKLPGVLGIHFEGPFISPNKAGVHDKKYIRLVSKDDLSVITSVRDGVTLLTLAPEIVPLDVISDLSNKGIKVSVGHSEAKHSQTYDALNNGASCVTHLFNAMSLVSSGREIGVLGAALNHENSWAGIIVDGIHVDFEGVKLAVNAKTAKGKGKLFLVTDAMPPVGQMPPAGFKLGPYDIRVEGGRLITGDGVLAGSSLDMASAIRNCIQKVGIPTDEALRMASTYKADFLGLSSRYGYIAPGYKANLTVFNNQIHVHSTVVSGKFEMVD
jgi:N-acetylglucosamine-6-phosphate deacetylase